MKLEGGRSINIKQIVRVEGLVEGARSNGTQVLAEGQIDSRVSAGGYFVKPVLFGGVARNSELAREEVFGPVLAILPFEDEADAVALANGTEYGLIAAVWTRDGGRQMRVGKKLRAGQVFVNCYGAGAGIELPFGGTGKSGNGREKGLAALREFTTTKTLIIHHG